LIRRQRHWRRSSLSRDAKNSSAASDTAANAGSGAVEKMKERARFTSHSIKLRDPQM
jgi:hypothetical protein